MLITHSTLSNGKQNKSLNNFTSVMGTVMTRDPVLKFYKCST